MEGSFTERTILHLRAAKALPDRDVQVHRKNTWHFKRRSTISLQ